jgi:cobalt-zinc-cadmium efflux system protein
VLPRTWTLLKQAGHILMQGVPEGMDVAAIRKRLIEMPAVQEVHDLHVWSLGTGQVVLTAHIVLAAGVPDPDTIQVELSRVIEQQFDIHDVTLQVERTSCRSEVGHA